MTPPLTPVPHSESLVHLDVLRAIALFGFLVVDLVTVLRVSIFAQFVDDGTGLAIQLERATARGAPRDRRLRRPGGGERAHDDREIQFFDLAGHR